jgi:hypothetical protein
MPQQGERHGPVVTVEQPDRVLTEPERTGGRRTALARPTGHRLWVSCGDLRIRTFRC